MTNIMRTAAAVALGVMIASGAAAETYTAKCVTSGGELNIRKHNWVGSEVIGYLCDGWDVEVESVTDNGWAHIVGYTEWGDGYCKIEYLTSRPDESGLWYNASGGRVRIRQTMGGSTKGWLKAGKGVNVVSWAYDSDGRQWAYTGSGWILGSYLSR